MRLGDLLEVVAGCAFTAAAYEAWGSASCLAVAGVCLVYIAQGFARTPLPKVKLKLPRPSKRG